MNQKFDNIDRFDTYLYGTMSKVDRIAFEKELASNESLSQEFEIHKDFALGVQNAQENELRTKLKNVENELKEENFFESKNNLKVISNNKSRFGIERILSLAAGVAILLGVAFFLFKDNGSSINPEDAFAKFYKPEAKALPIVLDRLETLGFGDEEKASKDSLAGALSLYEDFKYEESRSALVVYLNNHPEDKIANLYLGLNLLQQEDYIKASTHLIPLSRDANFAQNDIAMWYLALAYGQFGTDEGKNNARALMKKLSSQQESVYAADAETYLQYFE